jgi:hypothetical protein
VGGWWKCTDYQGGGLCQEQGVRYYLDCNRIPGIGFPGGCQCANGNCARAGRRLQPVPLRPVQHRRRVHDRGRVPDRDLPEPGDRAGLNCNGTLMIDNAVCAHEASCLEGLAVQLPGGGGA